VRSYTIEILPTARRELLSLPGTIQKRIGQKIDSLKNNARPTGVKALKSKRGDFYRLRVGATASSMRYGTNFCLLS